MKSLKTKRLLPVLVLLGVPVIAQSLEVAGTAVVPHVQSREMRYRREPDWSLGARVQVFLRNNTGATISLQPEAPVRVRGQAPETLLAGDEWAWHDFPSAWTNETLRLPPGALTVWSWNGKRALWGAGSSADIAVDLPGDSGPARIKLRVPIEDPKVWLSSVTFPGSGVDPFPDSAVIHIANQGGAALRMEAFRLWLPASNSSWRALFPQPWITNLAAFPADGVIPPGDRGGARVRTGRLPLTYAAIEVRGRNAQGDARSFWGHLRVKREQFDISGGWVSSDIGGRSTLTWEQFLKTLRRMHINTAHIGPVGGYTDEPALYEKYPLKYFNRLTPVEQFDTPEMLPRIHGVEFLGEPQYGGGRPVPPMEVWRALAPYQRSRLATTVTHSEERIWRFYAGLSDYPHYDAYRVTAPSPDAWALYDRWGGQRIRWGAPLETIGEMTRSLRELNRPAPIAYWSQGAHGGWDRYGGRQRTAPTPDELRMQAYQALAARITSLYWFNLSLKSLVKFPDLIEPMTRVGREIRMLEPLYLEGDAYSHRRVPRDGKAEWDLSVIAGPRGAICFALDLDYSADPRDKVFRFRPAREASLTFPLPAYLRAPAGVARVDAEAVSDCAFEVADASLRLRSACGPVNVFVVAAQPGLVRELENRRRELAGYEQAFQFDPAGNPEHLEQLRKYLSTDKASD
jgi:hypothetical protein